MNKLLTLLLAVTLFGFWINATTAQEEKKRPAPKLDTKKAKGSYALGYFFGERDRKHLGEFQGSIDGEALALGFRHGILNEPATLDDEQREESIYALQEEIFQALPEGPARTKRLEQLKKIQARAKKRWTQARAIKDEGSAYLQANKSKPGVKVTPSGLQYRVLKEGSGPRPKKTDAVKVHYTGKLVNGTVFDSSLKRNKPVVFKVGGVIPGWTEALLLMKVGSKWELAIPWQIAYGKRRRGKHILPYSVLVFEVELIAIEQPTKTGKR